MNEYALFYPEYIWNVFIYFYYYFLGRGETPFQFMNLVCSCNKRMGWLTDPAGLIFPFDWAKFVLFVQLERKSYLFGSP